MADPRPSKQGVDEWRYGRSRGQKDEGAEQYQHKDNREQPKLLALAQKAPQFQNEVTHTASPYLVDHLILTKHVGSFTLTAEDAVSLGIPFKLEPHHILAPHAHDHSSRHNNDVVEK